MIEEIWRDILEYEGIYQISNFGKVKSFARYKIGKLIYLKEDKYGYYTVQLHNNKIRKWVLVHRLVATAFISNPDNKPQVNHKNGVKKCNFDWNLEWATNSENQRHSFHELGRVSLKGEAHPSCKLTKSQIQEIKRLLNKNSVSQGIIGKMYDISQSQISRIKNNQSWRHLT